MNSLSLSLSLFSALFLSLFLSLTLPPSPSFFLSLQSLSLPHIYTHVDNLSQNLKISQSVSQSVSHDHLVSHEHDNDICLCMISQLLEPSLHILKSYLLGDVVNQKSTHCTTEINIKDEDYRMQINYYYARYMSMEIRIMLKKSYAQDELCSRQGTRWEKN